MLSIASEVHENKTRGNIYAETIRTNTNGHMEVQ